MYSIESQYIRFYTKQFSFFNNECHIIATQKFATFEQKNKIVFCGIQEAKNDVKQKRKKYQGIFLFEAETDEDEILKKIKQSAEYLKKNEMSDRIYIFGQRKDKIILYTNKINKDW